MTGPAAPGRLTLGPLLYNWSPEAWSDFYARIADEAPVDRIVLGEVVCSKRLPFYADRIPAAVERLQRAGKAVDLASLALITHDRERRQASELAAMDGVGLEVGDPTLLRWLDGRPFAVGPLVNVYNEGTLGFLARRGMVRLCLPPELPFASVAALARAAVLLNVEAEVWAFGRVPLALSGRCYHARVHGLAKDSCRFVCAEDPDGLPVETLDGAGFLTVNGVQTLSEVAVDALPDLGRLAEAGIGSFRLSPQTGDMVAVARLFRDQLDGRLEAREASAKLGALRPDLRFGNGFLFGRTGSDLAPRP